MIKHNLLDKIMSHVTCIEMYYFILNINLFRRESNQFQIASFARNEFFLMIKSSNWQRKIKKNTICLRKNHNRLINTGSTRKNLKIIIRLR